MERVEGFAAQSFQAARQLKAVGGDSPLGRLHGHGFRVAAWGALAAGENDARRLVTNLATLCSRYDYTWLNEAMREPDDATLGASLARQLEWPDPLALELASTPEGGSLRSAEGETRIWRAFGIEAAHRLPFVAEGHPCGRMHGHSFRIVFECAVGPAVRHPKDLDAAWHQVGSGLQGSCLNELPGLENPTAEQLSAWLWRRFTEACEGLRAVSVLETPRSGCRFDGSQHRIWKEIPFEAAVSRPGHPEAGARRLHGHGYRIRLHLSAPLDAVLGWTVDYGDVKAAFDPVRRKLDHHHLNDLPALADGSPLALARWIREQAGAVLPALDRVTVFEGPSQGVAVGRPADGVLG